MNIVTGCFSQVRPAEDAWNDLRNAGFKPDDLGFYVRDRDKGMQLAHDVGREYKDETGREVISNDTIYPNLTDKYVDTIRDSNLPDEAVDWYQQQLNTGNVLLVVEAGDHLDDAERFITQHGGVLYGRHGEAMQRGEMMERGTTTERGMTMERGEMMESRERTTHERRREGELRVPVYGEEVEIEKRRMQVGEVVVHSEESMREIEVPTAVTHQEIRVERRKLDRPVSPDDYKVVRTAEGEIRMPIVEEELVVTKRPIVREEMVITRVPVTEQRTVHETVRHTEPHVETTGDVDVERRGEEPPHGEKRRPAA